MPRADPSVSFDVAARHLFHHLDDAAALERNPLVRRFFEGGSYGSSPSLRREEVLQVIHSLIIAGGKSFRDAAIPRERERAARQFRALHGYCTGKKSVKQLAAQFGISTRQCYRECAEIFRYTAEFIRCYESETARIVQSLDPFELQMERAAWRIENGDYDRAVRDYKSMIAAGGGRRSIEAFCKHIDLELELGHFSSAQSLLSELVPLITTYVDSPSENAVQVPRAYADLFQSKLAWAVGDFGRAAQTLARARRRSERLDNIGDDRPKALYADVLYESATRATDLGDIAGAQKDIALLTGICDAEPALKLRTVDLLLGQLMLNFLQIRPGGSVTLRQQAALIDRARQTARHFGSVQRLLRAEVIEIFPQKADDPVIERIRQILAGARQLGNRRLISRLALSLADYLLSTQFWRSAGDLLHQPLTKGSYDWATMMLLRSVYNLKLGDLCGALSCAYQANSAAGKAGALRLQASALTTLAHAAHVLGRRDDATDAILVAIQTGKRHASAFSFLKMYRTAAVITGRAKYTREAQKMQNVLSI